MLNRREFLNRSSLFASSCALLSQSRLSVANDSTRPLTSKLATLHSDIIQQVKKLTQNKPQQLTLLYPKGCLANL